MTRRRGEWQHPETGEWMNTRACPGCELVTTRDGGLCRDCRNPRIIPARTGPDPWAIRKETA